MNEAMERLLLQLEVDQFNAAYAAALKNATVVPPDRHVGRKGMDRSTFRGYATADENKRSGDPIGVIAVDSVFSPVRRVSYRVESTRVEQMTNYDKLIVDVETKDAIAPRDAVASAGTTLVELFGLARELNVAAEGIEDAATQRWLAEALCAARGEPTPAVEYLHVPLVLNTEGRRLAKRDGAVTLEDLAAQDPAWTPERVRDRLLESLGLPPGPLAAAVPAFDPAALPRDPWVFTGL